MPIDPHPNTQNNTQNHLNCSLKGVLFSMALNKSALCCSLVMFLNTTIFSILERSAKVMFGTQKALWYEGGRRVVQHCVVKAEQLIPGIGAAVGDEQD